MIRLESKRGNMRTVLLTAGLVAALAGAASAQAPNTTLDTSDVDLFYRLYDATDGRPTAEQLQTDYINAGSPGLRTFLDERSTTAERIADAVEANPELYADARGCAATLPRVKGRVNAALEEFVALYPQARIPSVTVAVGRGRPVAIGSPVTGVQVGLEALCATDFINPDAEGRFAGVLIHEFVHAQQNPELTEKDTHTVLELALIEGGAEFVTELLLGHPAYTYFSPLIEGREREIETAFAADLDDTDLSDWFYNSTLEEPADLGYWVGYRIAQAYYANAVDKQAALRDILMVTDAHAFLAASGWAPGLGDDPDA